MKFVALVIVAGLVGTFAAGQGDVIDQSYVSVRDEVLVAYHSASGFASQVAAKFVAAIKL